MLTLLLILLLHAATAVHMQSPPTGQLTLVVRDESGSLLAGIRIGLYHDGDDTRTEVGEQVTDQHGQVVFDGLPWGLYIAQFRGMTPAGTVIQPPAEQNQRMLDDGAGASNGFGIRLAETERTELFVVTTAPERAHAVPLFDLAPSRNAPPQPYDPLAGKTVHRHLIMQPGTSTVQTSPHQHLQALAQERVAPSMAAAEEQPSRRSPLAMLCCLALLPILGVAVMVGWLRSLLAGQRDVDAY